MWRALLVLLSLVLCAAKIAKTAQSADYIPAPIFDEGENLSSQNCGNETTANQWIAYVKKYKFRTLLRTICSYFSKDSSWTGHLCFQ
ncbi:Hypothetical predicted protein [Cloeon dipterum]|uniref:Uncharacterized protein n=1 Tax=Cloeon dipterum TaxID=197152 RepID=A0A8S1DW03_9INSE|nr:Hypothetical predicted protein [Cloeon dipterum]